LKRYDASEVAWCDERRGCWKDGYCPRSIHTTGYRRSPDQRDHRGEVLVYLICVGNRAIREDERHPGEGGDWDEQYEQRHEAPRPPSASQDENGADTEQATE
jgi:hypothetical protein